MLACATCVERGGGCVVVSGGADELRKWRMLARVRELRVSRCQQMLGRRQRVATRCRGGRR